VADAESLHFADPTNPTLRKKSHYTLCSGIFLILTCFNILTCLQVCARQIKKKTFAGVSCRPTWHRGIGEHIGRLLFLSVGGEASEGGFAVTVAPPVILFLVALLLARNTYGVKVPTLLRLWYRFALAFL
jgi:hypothetical protein